MKKRYVLAVPIIAIATTLALTHHQPKTPPVSSNPSASCHIRGLLPDPICTPGSINPNVNQNDIQTTICVKGYTATIRPPTSYTQPLKKQIDISYGLPTNTQGELDHLISLELGGNPTDVKNLWVEPGPIPNPKDRIENLLHQRICSGQTTLLEAQKAITTDWTKVK